MNKYFELQYWIEIIGLIAIGLFIVGCIIYFLVDVIVDFYKSKSKKWTYNCILDRWERKDKDE